MKRRHVLATILVAAVTPPVPAHTPYSQWRVFRQRYLLILTSRPDPEGDALGERFAKILFADLPLSRAMVSRAPDLERIGSLITTDQAKFAVLSRGHAQALARGLPPFADYGPYPLHSIVGTGGHLLVCREDVPLHHAYLMAATLMNHAPALGAGIPQDDGTGIPLHPGVAAFARGDVVKPPS